MEATGGYFKSPHDLNPKRAGHALSHASVLPVTDTASPPVRHYGLNGAAPLCARPPDGLTRRCPKAFQRSLTAVSPYSGILYV
jgi:hypothetical protein